MHLLSCWCIRVCFNDGPARTTYDGLPGYCVRVEKITRDHAGEIWLDYAIFAGPNWMRDRRSLQVNHSFNLPFLLNLAIFSKNLPTNNFCPHICQKKVFFLRFENQTILYEKIQNKWSPDPQIRPPKCHKNAKFASISHVHVISSKELYKVTKQIHEEELHHAGYKKLIDFVCMIKSIAQFNCKILTACWGQSTYIFWSSNNKKIFAWYEMF